MLTPPLCIVCLAGPRGSCSPSAPAGSVTDWSVGGYSGLAGAPAGALARHDRTAHQQLAAPDTPGLAALERAGQAGDPGPAAPAHGLRGLHVLRRLGEEQLRILHARQIQAHRELGRRQLTHHADRSHAYLADLVEYRSLAPSRDLGLANN